MTHKKANKVLFGSFVIVVIWVLSGCMTAKNLPKHNDRFPLQAAEYAAKKFPVKDSVGQAVVDSVKKADNQDYTELIDSITELSDSLGLYEPPENDTMYFKDESEAARLRAMITKLRREYKPCKPDSVYFTVPHFVVDGAALEVANLKAAKEHDVRIKAEKEASEWKSKAKIRFWIIVSLSSILLLFIGMAVGKLLKRASGS